LEANKGTEEMIALKKQESDLLAQIEDDKNARIRDALVSRLEEVRLLQDDQAVTDQERARTYNDELLAMNDEFQQLSVEQQAVFRAQNDAALQSALLTEQTAKREAIKQNLKEQVDSHNQFLLNQQKFGTAYALINQIMHSAILKGTKSAFGEMAAMQNSQNATLKAIGKAAAVANIIIKTGESAMNIYAGFSTIPIIGPALGIAGAAAAIAFGAEQVGKVLAAADGGLIEGGIKGMDSVPALLMPGELVVPTQNYDEVINAVAASRAGSGRRGDEESSFAHLIVEFKGEIAEFVEAKLIERRRLNLSLQGA
jgi:hypothetical protein